MMPKTKTDPVITDTTPLKDAHLYVGMMSGTSLDGVDAVLLCQENHQYKILAHAHEPYPKKLKSQLHALNTPQPNEIDLACRAEIALTECYAKTFQKLIAISNVNPQVIQGIGAHGQTIRHAINADTPYTLQLLDGARLSYLCQQTVVCDFRRKDIAANGQGAPLAPYFHQALFGHLGHKLAVVNIGGISNVTILDKTLSGFDSGPGNALLDDWIFKYQGQPYDKDGIWAQSGNPLPDLLSRLLADDYFYKKAPKSTGRDYFHLDWLKQHLIGNERPEDIMRTLVALTATSIIQALPDDLNKIILCGGGAKNALLVEDINRQIKNPKTTVTTTDALGIDAQQVESAGFALLASNTLKKTPINTSSFTGAENPVILGAIYF